MRCFKSLHLVLASGFFSSSAFVLPLRRRRLLLSSFLPLTFAQEWWCGVVVCGSGGSYEIKGFLLEEIYSPVCLWRTYTCVVKSEGFQF